MQVAGQARAIAAEASVTNKRRRLHSAQPNSSTVHHPLPNHCCCSSVSVSPKNSVSPTTPFEFPNQVPQTSLCFNNQSITTISVLSDLKVRTRNAAIFLSGKICLIILWNSSTTKTFLVPYIKLKCVIAWYLIYVV